MRRSLVPSAPPSRTLCASCLSRLHRDAANIPPSGIAALHRRHITTSRRMFREYDEDGLQQASEEQRRRPPVAFGGFRRTDDGFGTGIAPRQRPSAERDRPVQHQEGSRRGLPVRFQGGVRAPPQDSRRPPPPRIRFVDRPQRAGDSQPSYDPSTASNWKILQKSGQQHSEASTEEPETTRYEPQQRDLPPNPRVEEYRRESETRFRQAQKGGYVPFRGPKNTRRSEMEGFPQRSPFAEPAVAQDMDEPVEFSRGYTPTRIDEGPSEEELWREKRMRGKALDGRSRRSRRRADDEDDSPPKRGERKARRRDEDDEDDPPPKRGEKKTRRRGEDDEDAPPLSRAERKLQRREENEDLEIDVELEERRLQRREQRRKEKREKAAAAQEATESRQTAPAVHLPEFISVSNLAVQLKQRVEPLILKMKQLGYEDVSSDQVVNAENAAIIAMEYDFEPIIERADEDLHAAPIPEDKSALPSRPPVVTIMGHVDHGKTTILDYLRKTAVVDSEHGGITQHIGAFSVPLSSGRAITFLDTPGHAAFLSMRARGANVTDIVVLVVAADDSVKPQTIEAIKHANAARVPIIVAINKIDKPEANPETVKQDLARHEITVEDYGGDTQALLVSGKTGKGMTDLEEAIWLQSEVLDHRAPDTGKVEGWIIEAQTKDRGRVATVLVRRGTLVPGTIIVAGDAWARVRSLRNEAGTTVQSAGPGIPVEIDGWREPPSAGDEVLQANDEQHAAKVINIRKAKAERLRMARDVEVINEARRLEAERREREEALAKAREEGQELSAADHAAAEAGGPIHVSFIIKADVSGSAEAVSESIAPIGNAEVAVRVLRATAGPVSEFDIQHAAAANGHVVNFNQPLEPRIVRLAGELGVRLLDHNIIYRLGDDVRGVLSEQLTPLRSHKVLGEAEIAQVFEIKVKRDRHRIAGCKVRNGMIKHDKRVKVLRGPEKEVVFDGPLDSLKNQKKDVLEIGKGSECGIGFEKWQGFELGDYIQCYEVLEEKRYL